jgi:hypothetical protein
MDDGLLGITPLRSPWTPLNDGKAISALLVEEPLMIDFAFIVNIRF